MKSVYCQQGHVNAPENRFCSTCGEKLPVTAGLLLGDRYRIRHELGQGGFGRTYLAEDTYRFQEACVLKEFAPQVQGSYALQKAEELFEREAGVLHQLKHPQIPQFRELFRAVIEGQERLFLVQDYVAGPTYRQLLEARRQQGSYFSEVEIWQLLEQILPVLDYLHRAGVIHRDISPDNLIQRASDQVPVLIDFGGVKQLAADATAKYTSSAETAPLTRLGKVGYAPIEQMHQGIVLPQSDLYALAVTALVLLTGKQPAELLDPFGHTQPWQQVVALSPELTAILAQMLAAVPEARFASAESVLQALHQASPPAISTAAFTQPVTHPVTQPVTHPVAPLPAATASRSGWLMVLLISLALLIGAGWWWRDRWWSDQWLPQLSLPELLQSPDSVPVASGEQQTLESQAEAAGVDFGFLVKLTNATFDQRYPAQAGRTLGDGEADAKWRRRWAKIADEWLTILLQQLSSEARQKLGSYSEADRNQWKQSINQLYVGSRSLYDLTDAKFFNLFPKQRGKNFLDQPIGQVWQAIAVDQIQALKVGKTLQQIEFEPGRFSQQINDDLPAGAGRVYTANLASGQIMRLNLQAPDQSSLLSIYPPRPTSELPVLLEDSATLTWTGTLPQSGYYEIVVINKADQPVRYQLNLAVDNVTSAPQPEQAEAPEAKD